MSGDLAWPSALPCVVARRDWVNATHDWSRTVEVEHVRHVRSRPEQFAGSGLLHLVFEVLAYAADEAAAGHAGRAIVLLEPDGTVSVSDDGRGTDTRRDDDGLVIRKPVMSTRDLRFFDGPGTELLPDGSRRWGISVVGALSEWLVHVNRRREGAWEQRYERGLPVTGLLPLVADGTTGTSVRFKADDRLPSLAPDADVRIAAASTPHLQIEVRDQRR